MQPGEKKSWRPTNKWTATQITATAALLVAWVNAGDWHKTQTIALIALITQALMGYLVPNHETMGGIPPKKSDAAANAPPQPRQYAAG